MSFSSERGTSQGPPQGIPRRTPQGPPQETLRGTPQGIPRRTPRRTPWRVSRRTPQGTSQGGPPQGTLRGFLWGTPREVSKETPKEKPKDTSFFGKGRKDEIPRDELRSILRKSSSRIPGTSRKYYKKDRIGLEKGIGRSAGSYISRQDIKNHIQKLKNERFKSKISTERDKIKDEINFWKKHSGIK